ncbi:MAG: HAD-IC family P-type ATPase, partial [Clostridia bacterium]|nr:HAD-IC family P-type ATPase [Clostridia bacterium]
PEAARAAAERIGADEGFGGLLPADKCALLEKEKERAVTAFAGDGINDAPAIASADVGIAMGALGSDAAIEAADVVLMGDSPSHIAKAMEVSAKAVAVAKENIWLCLIVKAGVLVASALGYAPMWLAVVADVGAAIAAVANSALNGK